MNTTAAQARRYATQAVEHAAKVYAHMRREKRRERERREEERGWRVEATAAVAAAAVDAYDLGTAAFD